MEKYIIIVAGGRGERMGSGIPKQFMLLDGMPILMHTIEQMAHAEPDARLIVVLPHDRQEEWRQLCTRHGYTRMHTVTDGGNDRFHSVLNALSLVPAGTVAAIHDGVRPLVSTAVVRNAFATASREGSAVPVVSVTESLRTVDNDGTSHATDRSRYRIVQTPQVFLTDRLKAAYAQPYDPAYTDDASVYEAAGYPVTLIEGNRENIKITYPHDMEWAHILMQGKRP